MNKYLNVGILLFSIVTGAQAFSSSENSSEYKCEYKVCNYNDGCYSYTNYLMLSDRKVYYWLDFNNGNQNIDYSNIQNAKKNTVSFGTITKKLSNGNFLVTGKSLISKYDAFLHYMYRELELTKSLVMGAKYGTMIEISHKHDNRSKDPTKESNPLVLVNRCVRIR